MTHPLSTTFRARNALVMGLGRFGGGLGATRFLLNQESRVTLNDRASERDLAEPLEKLGSHPNLRVALGEHDPTLLEGIDLLVVNPAVPRPWEDPFILEAQARGIRITTEVEMTYHHLDPNRVIAITGSAGKSTTSAMIHHTLMSCGIESVLGGNIGGSLLERLDEIRDETVVVLELSSAMIHWIWGDQNPTPPLPPHVACFTGYSPNHLDWHGDEPHYRASKQRLLRILNQRCTAVLHESIESWTEHSKAPAIVVRSQDGVGGCAVAGAHNALNAACAVSCISAMRPELNTETLTAGVRSFPGLPHRLHRCLERDGVIYIDDSKSTTPEATLLAVRAMRDICHPDQIHLIAGGYDKGSDLTPIAKLAPELAGLYSIGSTGSMLASMAPSNASDLGTLDKAMHRIAERVKPGDVVLLSPGCASWDQFTNYEARGRHFSQLAQRTRKANPC